MLTLLLALALQTPPTASPNDSIAWDYTDANISAGAVDHFDVCLDNAPCVSVTVTASKIAGQQSYSYHLPALTVGSHTATVKACNVATCSASNPSLTFQLVIQPQPITNLRIGGGL